MIPGFEDLLEKISEALEEGDLALALAYVFTLEDQLKTFVALGDGNHFGRFKNLEEL